MKVSVIIPVYNAKRLLDRCLQSLVVQTYSDFEVICVDDGSTDGSAAVLDEFALQVTKFRLKVIHQENKGSYQARIVGVSGSVGDYICFVDPDDWVKPQFLDRLVAQAEKGSWDIVQCGVEIEETRERTQSERDVSERYFNPRAPTLREGGILTASYIEKRMGWGLIFRLMRGDLVRRAFDRLPNVYLINETDAAAFFVIASDAKRYCRIKDRLYCYRYGDGISTRLTYSLEEYKRVLGKFDFLRKFGPLVHGAEQEAAFVVMAARMAENTRKSACMRLKTKDRDDCRAGLDALRTAMLTHSRPISHVGIHYFNLKPGGVQRVILQNAEVLRQVGLKVTLFLEDMPGDDDFSVPTGVEIKLLPKSLGNVLGDRERIPLVVGAMREAGIDCWYDHAVFSPKFVSDVTAAKWLVGIPVIAHYHTVFTAPLRFTIHPEYYELQAHWLRLADLVLVLGRIDAAYFRKNSVRAVVVPNKFSDMLREEAAKEPRPESNSSRTVLWCGRDSWEKHPNDVEPIIERVREMMPTVKLSKVTGVRDPFPFFRSASVLLLTSEFEGFSMTSAEALAFGLPIVSYRLDNLDIYRDNPAVSQVPQGDIMAAAAAIVEVLSRQDYTEICIKAKRSLRPFLDFNHQEFWSSIASGFDVAMNEIDDSSIALMESMQAEARSWHACHPHARHQDTVGVRHVIQYIRENGFPFAVRRIFHRVIARLRH